MSEQSQKSDNDFISRIAIVFGILLSFIAGLVMRGAARRSTWEWSRMKKWLIYFGVTTSVVYARGYDLSYWVDQFPLLFPQGLGEWIYFHLSPAAQLFLLCVIPFVVWLAILGAGATIRLFRFQKALNNLGMKTPSGQTLKAVEVISLGVGQRKILVSAPGFDVADLRSKKTNLESSLNLYVQEIRVAQSNRQIIEITTSDRELPTLIAYETVSEYLTEAFSFLIGDAMSGKFLVGNLLKVHHLLVAGASGGGKSFFVKQLLVGLLQSSRYIQLYLLDLKKGVEVKVFEKLENVYIAKEPISAIETLDAVVKEMDRRFDYLESKGYTEINCERDKLDRIVVLVDEASELFTVVRSSKAISASATSARDLADKIAKLGRVAGIHLILATQKVVKETVDTRVQANINARMIFRVNTVAASMTVLGNKLAADLPEIKGRGIWSVGSRDIVVQAPKLDNEEVGKKVSELTIKFNGQANPLMQTMLTVKRPKAIQKNNSASSSSENSINPSEGAF